MKKTRKQKIAAQKDYAAGRAADRVFDPIRKAIDNGELVITPSSPAASEPPKCEKHGLVMVQKFRNQRIGDVTELAIPTDEYSCIRCDDERKP